MDVINPMTSLINLITSLVGLVSLVLTIKYSRQTRTSYNSLMKKFEQKAIEVVMNVLERDGLRNADHVRGLITNTSAEYSVSVPSDADIVRILRRIALRYQQQDLGSSRINAILNNLELIRKEMDPTGPALASIASVNKMTAFQLVVGVTIISLFMFQVYNVMTSGPSWVTIITVACELLLLLLIIVTSSRIKGLNNKLPTE